MKIFTEKGILKKLLLIIIAIVLFNAIIPTNVSYAADVGGVLLKPIVDLMVALGDFVMDIINNMLYGMETSVIRIDTDNGLWEFLWIAAVAIVTVLAIATLSVALTGAALKIVGAIATKIGVSAATSLTAAAVGTIVTVSLGGGIAAGMFVRSEWFSNEIVMPMFRVTPEEIFSGKIRWLDVNFFKDKDDEISDDDIDTTVTIQNKEEKVSKNYVQEFDDIYVGSQQQKSGMSDTEISAEINSLLRQYGFTGEDVLINASFVKRWSFNQKAYEAKLIYSHHVSQPGDYISGTGQGGTNIFRDFTISEGEWIGTETNTLGNQLKPTIAKWYYAIRNFALIAMMVILLYIGVRIMLCGISSQKAKYKNMLMDWVVAICLIFVMHYIMAFSMNVAESIIDIFDSVNRSLDYSVVYEYSDKIKNALVDAGVDATSLISEKNGKKYISWDARNVVGFARVQAALNNSGTYIYMGWVMCYVVLMIYTVFFLFTYLRRALYLTFFTLIAPLVAMTYPLDKIHDGKAQAFDMWLKEYIFNLMIQPVHLLLYSVLINSAFDLASTNILYTLVAIGFMMSAEKFLRKMFGFDKAQTPGFLSGAAGTALMVSTASKLFNRKPSKGGNDGDGDGGGSSKGNLEGPVKTRDITDKNLLGQVPGTASGTNSKKGTAVSGENTVASVTSKARPRVVRPGVTTRKVQRSATPGSISQPSIVPGAGRKRYNLTPPKITPLPPKKTGFVGRQKRALRRASNEWAGQKINRVSRNIANGKPIKSLARTLGGLYMGAGGALLGATFALADDEPMKKMGQFVPTLATAGYGLGSRDIKPDYDVDSVYEEYKRGLYDSPEEYNEARREEERMKVIEKDDNARKIRDNLNLDTLAEARELMNEYGDCIDSGITDMDDLSTIIQLGTNGYNGKTMDMQMATTVAKYYKKAGGKPKNMAPDSEELNKITNICRNIAKSSGITNEAEINRSVQSMFDNLNLFGDCKDDLKEM